MKGICVSQSKNIKFEEYKNSLDGEKYQSQGDNHIIRSNNYEMVLQQIKKSIFSIFDDKRNYLNDNKICQVIESKV